MLHKGFHAVKVYTVANWSPAQSHPQTIRQRSVFPPGPFRMHRPINGRDKILSVLVNSDAVVHGHHIPPYARLPPRFLTTRGPPNTHLPPLLRRLDPQLHQVRPYFLAALVPSLESVLGLCIGGLPFTLQNAADGLRGDFEVLGEKSGRELLGLGLVEMAYAFHGVGGELLARVPGFSVEFLLHLLFVDLPRGPFLWQFVIERISWRAVCSERLRWFYSRLIDL